MPTREQDVAQWSKDAWQRWAAWEAEWARAQRLSPEEALRILDAMLALARAAQAWPLQTPGKAWTWTSVWLGPSTPWEGRMTQTLQHLLGRAYDHHSP